MLRIIKRKTKLPLGALIYQLWKYSLKPGSFFFFFGHLLDIQSVFIFITFPLYYWRGAHRNHISELLTAGRSGSLALGSWG